MKKVSLAIGVISLLALFSACSTPATFPANEGKAIDTYEAFGVVVAAPDNLHPGPYRLAGRIKSIAVTEDGTILFAYWLPYPVNFGYGPSAVGETDGYFTVLYQGQLDSEAMQSGNEFLVVGNRLDPVLGDPLLTRKQIQPHFRATCLHIWKTGINHLDESPDVENTGYPPLRQTYCVPS